MNLLSTIDGSLLEGFFPAGWDLTKIDACVDGKVLESLVGGWNMFGPIDTVTVPATLMAPLEGGEWWIAKGGEQK